MAMALNIPAPRRAEKRKVKMKLGIQGPSGSGKTWGALALATNLWPGAKICVIDTENGSAELYADRFEFDTIPLGPPFHTDRYIAAIEAIVKMRYDVCIIDQISHQWDGEGGILRRKEELDQRPGSNSYTNWSKFTPEHQRFKEAIVQAPIHIIATMRAKQDYILETNDKGKQTPHKVGMAAVQREGFDYEFTLLFDVQMDHKAVANKDRTALFSEQIVDLASPKIAQSLLDWLERGSTAAQPTTLLPEPQQPESNGNPSRTTAQTQPVTHPFHVVGNRVTCWPLNVQTGVMKKEPRNEYRVVKMNGLVSTGADTKQFSHQLAFCFHKSLFSALDGATAKSLQFEYEPSGDGKTISIVDVLEVGGQDYRNGKPYIEPAQSTALFEDTQESAQPVSAIATAVDSTEITDDDIPF